VQLLRVDFSDVGIGQEHVGFYRRPSMAFREWLTLQMSRAPWPHDRRDRLARRLHLRVRPLLHHDGILRFQDPIASTICRPLL